MNSLAGVIEKLPFRVLPDTIGQGTYAVIRRGVPYDKPTPVVAVKLINKENALKRGGVQTQRLKAEFTLHKHLNKHQNIIEVFHSGDAGEWLWICMELAEGGDLFDKIEADVGVGEDIAHLYFFQLMSAVAYMHDRGIAHRDLKPENILLSSSGNLKVADFGFATLYHYKGTIRLSTTTCGSPPYIAPEVLNRGQMVKAGSSSHQYSDKYNPAKADIWSCGIILFVLLVGNTPWDEPSTTTSLEFHDYIRTDGRPDSDELWDRIPPGAASLLRKMLSIDPSSRMSIEDARRHSWFTRPNKHLGEGGRARDPLALATQILLSLRIDMNTKVRPNMYAPVPVRSAATRLKRDKNGDEVDPAYLESLDSTDDPNLFAFDFSHTQPQNESDTLAGGGLVGANIPGVSRISSSQPITNSSGSRLNVSSDPKRTRMPAEPFDQVLCSNPALTQFSQSVDVDGATPSLPISLTQQARRFNDLIPSYSITYFLSLHSPALLVSTLRTALHTLGVIVSDGYLDEQFKKHPAIQEEDENSKENDAPAATPILPFMIPVRTTFGRRLQPMRGVIVVDRQGGSGRKTTSKESAGAALAGNPNAGLLEIRFVKMKGDPVEWRRMFKRVVVLCKEVVWLPENV